MPRLVYICDYTSVSFADFPDDAPITKLCDNGDLTFLLGEDSLKELGVAIDSEQGSGLYDYSFVKEYANKKELLADWDEGTKEEDLEVFVFSELSACFSNSLKLLDVLAESLFLEE
jgi:hypothetical protein